MFCPHCGNNIPDNSAFCGHCGASFAAAPAAAPVAVAAPTVPGLSAKKRGLSKKQFLATEAAPEVKTAGKLATAAFAVVLVLILLATITVNTFNLVNLPIIKMAVEEHEREELLDSMEDAADELEDAEDRLDEIKDEHGNKVFRQAKGFVKALKKTTRKFSLANVINLMTTYQKMADDVAEKLNIDDDMDELGEYVKVLKTVRTVTYIFGVVIALLALWAAAGKAVFPCVLGIILSVPVYCLLASVLLGILIFVAFIVLAVFCSKVNKAWKTAAV